MYSLAHDAKHRLHRLVLSIHAEDSKLTADLVLYQPGRKVCCTSMSEGFSAPTVADGVMGEERSTCSAFYDSCLAHPRELS